MIVGLIGLSPTRHARTSIADNNPIHPIKKLALSMYFMGNLMENS